MDPARVEIGKRSAAKLVTGASEFLDHIQINNSIKMQNTDTNFKTNSGGFWRKVSADPRKPRQISINRFAETTEAMLPPRSAW